MARRPVQRVKVVLVCFCLGCMAVPVWAALGSTQVCTAAGSAHEVAGPDAAPRSGGCLAAGTVGGLSYDSNSDRCVQGGSGCDLHTL